TLKRATRFSPAIRPRVIPVEATGLFQFLSALQNAPAFRQSVEYPVTAHLGRFGPLQRRCVDRPDSDARARRVRTGQNAPLLQLKTRPFSLDSSGENRRNGSSR